MSTGELEVKMEAELKRLEEGLPQMTQQRDQLTQQILRVEGAVVTLKALLTKEEAVSQLEAEEVTNGGPE